jgi:outer membrane protein assembly factor BamA
VLYAVAAAALGHAQVRPQQGPVVRSVSFEGNHEIDDAVLRRAISTSQSSWFARSSLVRWLGLGEKRYLREMEFRRDVLRLMALYRQSGFTEAVVDTVVRREDDAVRIRFLVDEGEPVRVDTIVVTGHERILPTSTLMDGLPLQVGAPFNRLLLLASADTIRARLANSGYPFTEVFRNFDIDREQRKGRVHFEVDPGSVTRVGDIEITGLDGVDEHVVRRALTLEPGELYRERELYRSQLELYRTDLFSYVSVIPRDSLVPDAADSVVDVRVRLAEAPRHRVRLGGGYGTIDCFRAQASYTLLNFLGGGRSLQLQGRTSKIGAGEPLDFGLQNSICGALAEEEAAGRLKLNYNLTASFVQPHVIVRQSRVNVTLFAERYTEYRAYLREAIGGDFGVGYDVTPRLPISLSYGLSYGSTQAELTTFCAYLNVCNAEDAAFFAERRRRATLTFSVLREHRNSVLNPTRGSRIAGELVWASPLIGSDTLVQFTKGSVEFSAYRSLTTGGVLGVRMKLGTVLPTAYGAEEQEYVPSEDRFYAGGANSVRGYGHNELGPKVYVQEIVSDTTSQNGEPVVTADTTTRWSPTGANNLLLVNLEYRFPLPGVSRRISVAAFVDGGRLSGGSGVGSSFRVTPGIGVRLGSPLGPIRLDIGFNPYPAEEYPLLEYNDDRTELIEVGTFTPERDFFSRWRLHLSVGQPF